MSARLERLAALHRKLDACTACPRMHRPVVHGPAVDTRIMLVGQAPGPREGAFGHPFAWTAGKTMFGWFERALGLSEAAFRSRVYIAAVARCFPGKAKGGGDRKPDRDEIAQCQPWLRGEVDILKPLLLIPVGTLAIEQVFGKAQPLVNTVGTCVRTKFHGAETDVICLPHPSGASTWHRTEPGKALLSKALSLLSAHESWKQVRS